jgi:hypothetical protein
MAKRKRGSDGRVLPGRTDEHRRHHDSNSTS